MGDYVVVKGGLKLIKELIDKHLQDIYEYNSMLRGTGYYLKPVHIVTKQTPNGKRTYYYFGRYWWRIEYVGKRGRTSRIRWHYLGKEKPREDLPEPPRNPLEGLRFYAKGDDIYIEKKVYLRFKHIFKGLPVEEDP